MTRINLIAPKDLTDQHLLAEYRELPRIFGAIRNKLLEKKEIKIGKQYKMGTGHVIFFYNKLGFLEKRYKEIVKECQKRSFNISFTDLDLSDIPIKYKNDFTPSINDLNVSLGRIKEKLNQKKGFYRVYGKLID